MKTGIECYDCGTEMESIWFEEKEYRYVQGMQIPTGRKRMAVSYLECPNCFNTQCVDDSLDQPWR